MQNNVEKIKEQLSITDVVSSYIKLMPAGKNFKTVCPFHSDKDPSFYVSPERDTYYCFGCGEKGDIFSFVEKFEGVDFKGALKLLADKSGVKLENAKTEGSGEKERLFSILSDAEEYFFSKLKENTDAKSYLLKRGIDENLVDIFRIGYAKENWDSLLKYLIDRGYTESELLSVGLIKKKDGGNGVYDVFRGRIIFPVDDNAGRVVAFSGRIFPPLAEGEEPKGDRGAKYLNTKDTALFHKSKILYGYDKAKTAMRKYDFCILVEGQTDVILSYKAGFPNTIAPLGTSLTEDHLLLIKRFTSNIVFAFDSDSAGLSSIKRSSALALKNGFDIKVAKMPTGNDPADVILADKKHWKKIIKESKHVIHFLMTAIKADTMGDERKYKLTVGRELLPIVAIIENKIDQSHFIKELSKETGVSEVVLTDEVAKFQKSSSILQTPVNVVGMGRNSDSLEKEVVGFILLAKLKHKSVAEDGFGKSFEEVIKNYDKDELLHLAEKATEDMGLDDENKLTRHITELCRKIKKDRLLAKRQKILEELKSDKREDEGGYKKYQELSREIDRL